MGDPAGAGPAALAQLLSDKATSLPALAYFGTAQSLQANGFKGEHATVSSICEGQAVGDKTLLVIEPKDQGSAEPGIRNDTNAPSIVHSLNAATDAVLNGEAAALVTLPIHKGSLYSAGFSHPGHTEFLADKAGLGPDDVVMMLACESLRVVPLTIHIPLSDVPKALTTDLIIRKALITHQALKRQFGISHPKLVIAGLNPHAGEDGSIGHEEATHIQPALWALEDMGIQVTGPLSADTMFHAEASKHYDAALCCYHDQALIPIKTIDIWGGVNVTLGLPFVRTSPDHGTAFDAVATGMIKPDSTLAAIKMAERMLQQQSAAK